MTPETIATHLRHDLLTGALRPGDKLNQAEIAARFSVSRIPARDALALLAAEGLIDQTPNRGARVLSLTSEEIDEVFDLRVMLETDCLARAIPRMTPDSLATLDYALKRSDVEATGPDWAAGDAMFHETLYAPSERRQQIALIARLRRTCQLHIAAWRALPAKTPLWLSDHARLVELTRAADIPAATACLTDHLRNAQLTLQSAMAARP